MSPVADTTVPRPYGTRAEHLAWCKERALQYVEIGDLHQAFASFGSDMNKHDETAGHAALTLGLMLMMGGHLSTPAEMRKFIEGAN